MIKSEEIMKKVYSKPIADVIEIDEICTAGTASDSFVVFGISNEEAEEFE